MEELRNGSVVISAITSCPIRRIPCYDRGRASGKKGCRERPQKPRYVKSSFGPGSLVVTEYLNNAGLLPTWSSWAIILLAMGVPPA